VLRDAPVCKPSRAEPTNQRFRTRKGTWSGQNTSSISTLVWRARPVPSRTKKTNFTPPIPRHPSSFLVPRQLMSNSGFSLGRSALATEHCRGGPHRPACDAYWLTEVRAHVGSWEHKKGRNAVTSGQIRSRRPIGRHRTATLSATLSTAAQQSDWGEPKPDSPSPTR
jgi:hypothetical protein